MYSFLGKSATLSGEGGDLLPSKQRWQSGSGVVGGQSTDGAVIVKWHHDHCNFSHFCLQPLSDSSRRHRQFERTSLSIGPSNKQPITHTPAYPAGAISSSLQQKLREVALSHSKKWTPRIHWVSAHPSMRSSNGSSVSVMTAPSWENRYRGGNSSHSANALAMHPPLLTLPIHPQITEQSFSNRWFMAMNLWAFWRSFTRHRP